MTTKPSAVIPAKELGRKKRGSQPGNTNTQSPRGRSRSGIKLGSLMLHQRTKSPKKGNARSHGALA
jgi:hypothetical protein